MGGTGLRPVVSGVAPETVGGRQSHLARSPNNNPHRLTKSGATPDLTRETRVLPQSGSAGAATLADLRDEPRVFRFGDDAWNGAARFLESGKVPEVLKIAALLRFHGLNGTVFAFEKDTFAIWFFLQRQSTTISAKARETLDDCDDYSSKAR